MKSLKSILFVALFVLLISVTAKTQEQWVIYTTNNSGLPSNIVMEMVIDSTNAKWFATSGGLARFKNNVWTVWDTSNSPLTSNGLWSITQDKENNFWIATRRNGIFKFDGVNSWIRYYYTNTGYNLIEVNKVSVDDNNTVWVCSLTGLFQHIRNDHWKRYSNDNSGIPHFAVDDIAFEGHIKWVGTVLGGIGKFNDTIWTVYNHNNTPLVSDFIERIGIDRYNNKWFCTRFGGVAKFNSGQNEWTIYTSTNSGLPSNNTAAIYIDDFNTKWIGIQDGGFVTYNDTTWNYLLAGTSSVTDFKKDKYGNVWICTNTCIRVYNPTGVIGIQYVSEKLPLDYELFQNYPNPFNSGTIISFSVPKASRTKIVIYDILGREAKVLCNNNFNTGKYNIRLDMTEFVSGIYFYSMYNEGNLISTKKLILIK